MARRNMCEDCKIRLRPENFSLLFTAVRDICSYCGKPNFDGIYVRENTVITSHNEEQISKGELKK